MKELQKDSTIAEEVQKQLAELISGTPALQKAVAGQVQKKTVATLSSQHSTQQVDPRPLGAAGISSVPQGEDYNLLDMNILIVLTVRDKRYHPHEFAA